MMGNHEQKRIRALEHNRLYAIKRGETAATEDPKQAVNIGTIGHVDHGKTTLSEAIKKEECKPLKWWRSLCKRVRSLLRCKRLGVTYG